MGAGMQTGVKLALIVLKLALGVVMSALSVSRVKGME